jgi:hypothetical protein
MHDKKPTTISRRDAMKALVAAGVAALTVLPEKWARPDVKFGAIPAHAQTSRLFGLSCAPNAATVNVSGEYDFTSTVTISPAVAGISMTYSVSAPNAVVLNPIQTTGTAVTNGSGAASVNVGIAPTSTGDTAVVTWSFTNPGQGTGQCAQSFPWTAQIFKPN